MRCLGIPATLEIAEFDGQPQHSSITVCPFERTAALAGGGGEEPRYSAHSRIPTQSHRRSANSLFVGADIPQINMPAKAINGLPTHAAESLQAYMRALDMAPIYDVIGDADLLHSWRLGLSNRHGVLPSVLQVPCGCGGVPKALRNAATTTGPGPSCAGTLDQPTMSHFGTSEKCRDVRKEAGVRWTVGRAV